MIPKKIHYCWFSGKEMPEEYQNYIKSWQKICPDYEIIRWDESNYDITQNRYMFNAYQEERWGFVPDYARFDIIYREGGFYLDTDVELIRSLDFLREEEAYMGFEEGNAINPGCGFGAEAGNIVIRELRDMYDSVSFYREDGSLNLIPSPEYISALLVEMGVKRNNKMQRLQHMTIYPREYFGAREYTTGREIRTSNTCSIHHYTSSWMTVEEKRTEEKRKKFCTRYGQFAGNRIHGLDTRFQRLKSMNIGDFWLNLWDHFFYSVTQNEKRLERLGETQRECDQSVGEAVILSPACKSQNLGDYIIDKYCHEILQETGITARKKISTHRHPSKREEKYLKKASTAIVAGSNLLCGDMHHCQWKLPDDYQCLQKICLLGCGWSKYENRINEFSKRFYQTFLGNEYLHSVRDRYTEGKLRSIGVENVVYTGCPTMWNLTPEHCARIPVTPSKAVITSLTSYQANEVLDRVQIEVLCKLYQKVYFWPQGTEDEAYLNRILTKEEKEHIQILERELSAFDQVLENGQTDYVGSRLHGGIYALQKGCRTIVIAIDNRGTEIGKDTNLPVIPRDRVLEDLESLIMEEWPVSIHLPWDNISRWKRQFEGRSLTNEG